VRLDHLAREVGQWRARQEEGLTAQGDAFGVQPRRGSHGVLQESAELNGAEMLNLVEGNADRRILPIGPVDSDEEEGEV
jgi:hypothetical protein